MKLELNTEAEAEEGDANMDADATLDADVNLDDNVETDEEEQSTESNNVQVYVYEYLQRF